MAANSSAVVRRALKDACGAPGFSLACNFFAYGCMLSAAGFDIFQSLFSTFLIYALPGQIALADGFAGGSAFISIVTICWLVNLRLLPMSLNIAPIIKQKNPFINLLSIHFVAITGWLNFFSNYKDVTPQRRFHYYIYSNLNLWLFAFTGTIAGFYLKDSLPQQLFIALLMLNPLYFLCALSETGIKKRGIGLAVIGGFFLYPLFGEINSDWGIIFAGIIGGSLAYLLRYKILQKKKDK